MYAIVVNMGLEYHNFILLPIAGFLISAVISVLSAVQRKGHLTATFSILMLAVALWLFTSIFEYASTEPAMKFLWVKIEYIFIISLPVHWFIFTAIYTGRRDYVATRFLSLLIIIPVISLALVWTNQWHNLMWSGYTIVNVNGLSHVVTDRNVWFWIHSAYSYILLLAGTFFLFRYYLSADKLRRRQAGSLLIGALVPWVSNITFLILSGAVNFTIDPTPLSFSVTGIIFFFSIAQLRLLDLLPIARDEIIRSLDDGVFVLDTEHRVIDVNPAAIGLVAMIGTSSDNLVGTAVERILPQVSSMLEESAGYQFALQFDFKYEHDSRLRYFSASLLPVKDNIQQKGSLLIVRETTRQVLADEIEREKVRLEIEIREREKTETILRESEERYRTIFESANDIHIVIGNDGHILDINDRVREVIGYKREDFIGTNIKDLSAMIPIDMQARFTEFFIKVSAGNNEPPLVVTIYTRDNKAAEIEFNAVPIFKDGGIKSVFAIARDLTERRAAEKALLRLATAIEQSADAVMITDSTGSIQYANPAFEQITGYPSEEVNGKTPRILKSGRHDDDFYADMWKTICSGMRWSGTFINRKKNGTLYHERTHVSPVFDGSGEIVNFVAIKRDVTRELEMENQLRQSQKMEAVGRLAGGVAHDFNNILTVISVCSDMLKDSLDDKDERMTDVLEIVQATDRAQALTRQLLAFSRHQRLEPVEININVIIKEIHKMLSRLIGEDISLELNLDDSLREIKADRSGIEQVVINLVVNARDAMPEGGKIVIATENIYLSEADVPAIPEGKSGNFARISVTDNGIGMSRETMEHIFDPFFTTKERGKGTGLGLSTVYGIVRQSGGWINVYSEPDKGSSFRIYFPWLTLPENVHSDADNSVAPEDVRGNGERLLLVEDEEPIRRVACQMLKDNNYTVYSAKSAEEAIAVCASEQGNFSLIISDVVLPGLSGVELAEYMNEHFPDIKILLSSGYADEKSQLETIEKKGYPFVQKPYTAGVILRIIKDILF